MVRRIVAFVLPNKIGQGGGGGGLFCVFVGGLIAWIAIVAGDQEEYLGASLVAQLLADVLSVCWDAVNGIT